MKLLRGYIALYAQPLSAPEAFPARHPTLCRLLDAHKSPLNSYDPHTCVCITHSTTIGNAYVALVFYWSFQILFSIHRYTYCTRAICIPCTQYESSMRICLCECHLLMTLCYSVDVGPVWYINNDDNATAIIYIRIYK